MKFLQISDLHLGKRLKEYSLIEDQKHVLSEALSDADSLQVDGIFLCGDIYDSTLPSAEATSLLDDFLAQIHQRKLPCFLISGNHDSAEKLHYGQAIFQAEGIHLFTNLTDALTPVRMGDVLIYGLPFTRPADVNAVFGLQTKSYAEALSAVVDKLAIDKSKTNLLLAHQTVLPEKGTLTLGGSEEILGDNGVVVGDVSSVPASLFKDFDYVALGHIHKPQTVAKNARYAGSILKYHRDEAALDKSFTLLEAGPKQVSWSLLPIHPLHDVIHLTGTLEEILHQEADTNAYVFASLTDTSLLDDPMSKLKSKYPYAAWVDYVSRGEGSTLAPKVDIEKVSKQKLFSDFFAAQTGKALSSSQQAVVTALLEEKPQ